LYTTDIAGDLSPRTVSFFACGASFVYDSSDYRHATNTARVVTTGQEHHIISRRIAAALDVHPTLAGQYTPRDPRFVTQALDDAAHRGYQTWHRQLDAEVVDWLASNPNATTTAFEQFLRGRYAQEDLIARFPNGF
jgi:hypothetical protein